MKFGFMAQHRPLSKLCARPGRAPHLLCHSLLRDRSGATAVIIGMMLPMLVGFGGMAVEIGTWYSAQHRLQAAADGAAFSAAVSMLSTGGNTARDGEVSAILAKFGLQNGAGGVTVTGPRQPGSGSFTANASAV